MIRNKSALALLVCLLASPVWAVAPGGVYRGGDSMKVTLDPKTFPRTLGYHLVHGYSIYHGRKVPFWAGVFLPPAFFRSTAPMPILVGLHNRYCIGQGPVSMQGEGLGQMLAVGNPDDRAEGDKCENPISLRQDAQFIGLIPLCPGGFNWEDPPITDMVCSFVDQTVAHYHADADRVYLGGFSYGASSSWRIALHAPDYFAAIICCDGRASPDPVNDVRKLKDLPIYLEVGQWDGDFVAAADQMHQALNALPHRNYIFHQIPGGNHFNYQSVYNDPLVWKWVLGQRRQHKTDAVLQSNDE